jgi:DNA-binding NarL/FixJ family response regulator/TolA-binding protein
MVASEKITILLADEDALRRDGLAAVLQGASQFEVVAQCPDGETAIDQIRRLRPDVAVIDLNLPRVHGIELVRRVRSEALATKVVILSGTADDEIVREVVRAGGDGYLLKNGPARHLIDAISYVRDGGQYFSPQLRRDGRDRHLLEETPRVVTERVVSERAVPRSAAPGRTPRETDEGADEEEDSDEGESEQRSALDSRGKDSRSGKGRRAVNRSGNRRTSDPQRLRERLREDSDTGNLDERDYEILSLMADGIKPILDRLDEIEGRVGEMETGEAPVPSNVRGWLNTQMTDTFQDSRSGPRDVSLARSVGDLEARLPQLIEEAVTNRFHNMASKLQQEIEETHVRTLETFVKNIQVKLVQRVSALETDMSKQAEAMNQLREYSQRTEDNLSRLITGVDKLAQELPRRLAAAAAESSSEPVTETPKPKVKRKSSRSNPVKWFWIGVLVLIVGGYGVTKLSQRVGSVSPTATSAANAAGSATPPPSLSAPPAGADTKTKLQAASQYTDRKDYSTAEDIYKQVLKSEPNNVDALKGLASVLYREDKIDESTAILDKIPRN